MHPICDVAFCARSVAYCEYAPSRARRLLAAGAPGHRIPRGGFPAVLLEGFGLLDEHHRDVVDDRIAQSIGLTDERALVFTEVDLLLALRTCKHLEEFFRDHRSMVTSARRLGAWGFRRSGRARRETLLAPPPSMAAGVRSMGVVSRSAWPSIHLGFPKPSISFSRALERQPPAAHRILPNRSRIASALPKKSGNSTQVLGFSIVRNAHLDSDWRACGEENGLLMLGHASAAGSTLAQHVPRETNWAAPWLNALWKSQALNSWSASPEAPALLEDDPDRSGQPRLSHATRMVHSPWRPGRLSRRAGVDYLGKRTDRKVTQERPATRGR